MRLKILKIVPDSEIVFATSPENREEKVGTPYAVAPEIKLKRGMVVEAEISHPKNPWKSKRLIEKIC